MGVLPESADHPPYVVYGPPADGGTTVLFESVPTCPDAGRLWDAVDRLGATSRYTAPIALRTLMAAGDAHVLCHSRKTLRALGSVGEASTLEAGRWYFNVVGAGAARSSTPAADRNRGIRDHRAS